MAESARGTGRLDLCEPPMGSSCTAGNRVRRAAVHQGQAAGGGPGHLIEVQAASSMLPVASDMLTRHRYRSCPARPSAPVEPIGLR
jgi:hypothetical protein